MAWMTSLPHRLGDRTLGIASITLAVLLLSLSDALVKTMGDRLGLAQIVVLRSSVAALAIAGAAGLVFGPGGLRPTRPLWVWTRSLCLAAMWFCYYAALPSISLALAAACYYTAPAWMALLSRFVLGEAVGRAGWAAIVMALAGVVLAVNPGVGTLSPVVALPLAAAFFYALAGIVTWSRCRGEAPAAMALNLNLVLVLAGGLGLAGLALFAPADAEGFVLAVWPALRPGDWLLVALLGLMLAVIATAVAAAYRLAPSPVVGVFDNAYLVFAALWGVVFFHEVPTPQQAAGMGLIAVGAVLMAWHRRADSE